MNITVEKAKKTIYEMLRDRNYKNIVEEDNDIIIADNTLLVFFSNYQKINKDNIQTFTSKDLQTRGISHGIFVYPNTITSTAKNVVLNNRIDNIFIELFHLVNLQYNITKHRLVPRHSLVNLDEAKDLKLKYGKDLPKIYISDPVVIYYNFARGDILKICIDSTVAYRIVV